MFVAWRCFAVKVRTDGIRNVLERRRYSFDLYRDRKVKTDFLCLHMAVLLDFQLDLVLVKLDDSRKSQVLVGCKDHFPKHLSDRLHVWVAVQHWHKSQGRAQFSNDWMWPASYSTTELLKSGLRDQAENLWCTSKALQGYIWPRKKCVRGTLGSVKSNLHHYYFNDHFLFRFLMSIFLIKNFTGLESC